MQRRWRLTVECHKLHNGLYFKSPNHETSRATLALSSLFRVGKILIYANAYHKQDACYTGITRDAGADSFIPTVCFAD